MKDRSPDPRENARAESAHSPFGRRSFLRGALAAGAAGAAVGPLIEGAAPATGAVAADGGRDGTGPFPFYGVHQAGIDRPPPTQAQPVASFVSFDVTVPDRRELAGLFRALTERASFLTSGGTPPKAGAGPRDDRLLGGSVVPDGLTVTAAVGASLFDGRYGLAGRKPVQLKTMQAFEHDDLNPAECHGDLLLQLCAGHRDVLVHAFLDILAYTGDALRPRWRADAFLNPPRPNGTPRDMLGFKDGIANPDTGNAKQMNQQVWVQARTTEPAWTVGGTYQAVRIVRFFVEEWNKVPVGEQERAIGRRKVTGAPLYGTDESQDPVYTNDPQGRVTPLNAHIRLANPQTSETVSTSTILRRSYQYIRTPDPAGDVNIGHVFCCFQQELNTYIAMQTRLESEPLVEYISPTGGGYFFVLPGVRDSGDYYARGLLA
jgi:deferrochelatase/peroxidase EfeB